MKEKKKKTRNFNKIRSQKLREKNKITEKLPISMLCNVVHPIRPDSHGVRYIDLHCQYRDRCCIETGRVGNELK